MLIVRSFRRFRSTFFINLIGLSAGMASTLLIYLWVSDELAFDKFHKNDSRLYQAMMHNHNTEGIQTSDGTPGPLAGALVKEMPEVEFAATVLPPSAFGKFTMVFGEKRINAFGQTAGKDFFNIFSYGVTEGDPNQMLNDKSSIVISRDLAIGLFGTTENVIGKSIEWQLGGFKMPVIVSGVYAGTPVNSTAQFDFVFPFEVYKDFDPGVVEWGNIGPRTYLTVREGTDAEAFNKKLADYIKSKNKDSKATLFLKKYSDNYLYGKYEDGVQTGGRIEYVQLFSFIAVFILAIACINFMNLSTAKASAYVKQIGIKKAMGASRKTLILQYMGESMVMAFISLVVAVLIVFLLLPQFSVLTGKDLNINLDGDLILSLLGVTVFTGLIAGSYPALYLSAFDAVSVLKGRLKTSISELWARKGLVVFQFTLSVILIASVVVIYKQMQFIQNKNLGYDKNSVVYFEKEGRVAESPETFIEEIKNLAGVVNASSTGHKLIQRWSSTGAIQWEGKDANEDVDFEIVRVGYDFIETLNIKLLEGRSYSRDYGADASKVVFNEEAIKVMGLNDPIGKVVNILGKQHEIIGVVGNFHFESLYEEVRPLFFMLVPEETSTIVVRIEPGTMRETIGALGNFYKTYNPGFSFDCQILDASYQALYSSEERVQTLSRYFASTAILLSCLGLFGLAAFTAQKRLKEIGIRKVLGSKELQIFFLLSRDFTMLVIISIIIGVPVSYFIAQDWLNSFAYRIELSSWYFIAAGLLALFVAWITVSVHAIRAANVNVLDCLREE
jgi:putative ABC transport system permease protein